MTRVSSRKLTAKNQNRMFYLFWKSVAGLKDVREMEFFTGSLFSPVEKVMIAKRFMIALLLCEGLSFRQICDTLKVSPNTISSVSKKLNRNRGGYAKIIDRFLKDTQVKKLSETFLN
ncbi:MAG: Trp family transcriptional regulator [Patescibacteria group bacterium]|nr:Trp family transcriptional regulator [Patescibacteria group bacterium]